MPPILSRKRLRSDSPQPEPSPPKRQKPAQRRNNVFQTLDAPPKVTRTLSQTRTLLEQQAGDDDDDSELSEPATSDDDFEDVLTGGSAKGKSQAPNDGGFSDSQEDEWEDAMDIPKPRQDHGPAPVISGDIALTLSAAPKTAFEAKTDGKKGPSKVQRQIRSSTHCIHVQCLMFHNLMRNAWIQDKDVQTILVQGLPSSCWREIDQYWRDVGEPDGANRAVVARSDIATSAASQSNTKSGIWRKTSSDGVQVFEAPSHKSSGDRSRTSKPSMTKDKKPRKTDRNVRDWGATSEPAEPAVPNLSAGDPLLRLLRYLSAHWKSKFKVTTPTLRKRGYLPPSILEAEINAWRTSPSEPELFGERIDSIEAFREKARSCIGSRDLGQQLFTALLRGLGIEARMITSLQPVGFGFSQAEEGKPRNLDKLVRSKPVVMPQQQQGKLPKHDVTRKGSTTLAFRSSDDSDLSSAISISSDTDQETMPRRSPKSRNYSEELPYPTYWTEAISHLTHTPIAVSSLPRAVIASSTALDKLQEFYARGGASDKAKQVFSYIIAFSSDGTAKDVTTRYLPKHQWPGRTKGFRMPVEKIPVHNKRGKIKHWEEWDWFKSVMRLYARPHNSRQAWDEVEDEGDLVPAQAEQKKASVDEGGKETLQGYKNSVEYVLERHLRREEALKPGAKIVKYFTMGKGDKETSEPVYLRNDIVPCKTVESWHKEGREVREGQQPLKFVPMRAVTVTRKREIEERERDEGVKPKQGLYSRSQTDWIIPPPIVDGKIPRNAFNNIDVYVPTMVPKGAVHIPLKGTARICRKLNIEHAEACTGFEFGKQRAVPVLTGVVVAAENEHVVIDAWEAEEVEKAKKEADKREKLVLNLWKKFLSGLRIIERMKVEYGEDIQFPERDDVPITKLQTGGKRSEWEVFNSQADFEGGFIRDGDPHSEPSPPNIPPSSRNDEDMAGGFLMLSQEDPVHGELVVEHGDKHVHAHGPSITESAYQTPISLTSALQQPYTDASGSGDEKGEAPTKSDKPKQQEPLSERPSTRQLSKSQRVSKPSGTHNNTLLSTPDRWKKFNGLDTACDEDNDHAADVFSSNTLVQDDTPLITCRSSSKREAARKSDAQIKSHFFAQKSDDETDLTDRTSPMKGTRGRNKTGSRKERTRSTRSKR